jgi:hypothetical protein
MKALATAIAVLCLTTAAWGKKAEPAVILHPYQRGGPACAAARASAVLRWPPSTRGLKLSVVVSSTAHLMANGRRS